MTPFEPAIRGAAQIRRGDRPILRRDHYNSLHYTWKKGAAEELSMDCDEIEGMANAIQKRQSDIRASDTLENEARLVALMKSKGAM